MENIYILRLKQFFCLLLFNDTRFRTPVESINVPPASLGDVLCNGTDGTVFLVFSYNSGSPQSFITFSLLLFFDFNI